MDDDEPTWEELTVPENEPDWDELYEADSVDNMFQAGPDPWYQRRGFFQKEFAEGMKNSRPDIYYSWEWTPLPPEGAVPDEWWEYRWTPDRAESETD